MIRSLLLLAALVAAGCGSKADETPTASSTPPAAGVAPAPSQIDSHQPYSARGDK